MKRLMGLILILPLQTYAAKSCDDLIRYGKNLEEKLNNKRVLSSKECADITPSELGIEEAEVSLFEEYKCLSFQELDLKLKSYDHDIQVLEGIDSLKASISNEAEMVLDENKKAQFQAHSQELMRKLEIAQDLEAILATGNNKLTKALNNSDTPQAFKKACDELYKKQMDKFPEVCLGYLEENRFNEIKEFAHLFGQSNGDIARAHNRIALPAEIGVKSYKELLAKFNFNKDKKELTLEEIETLNKIAANMNPLFRFQTEIKEQLSQISPLVDAKKSTQSSQRLSSLLSEMIQRKTWQKNTINGLFSDVLNAQDSSNASLAGDKKRAESLLKSTDGSIQSYQKLKDLCSVSFPPSCEEALTELRKTSEEALKHSKVLNKIRAQHAKENEFLIHYRNYVLEQIHLKECPGISSVESNIDSCSDLSSTLSEQVISITLQTGKILATLDKHSATATDLKKLCKQETKEDIPHQNEICEHANNPEEAKEDEEIVITPPQIDTSWMIAQQPKTDSSAAIGGLFNTLAGILAPQPSYNPFAHQYSYPVSTYQKPSINTVFNAHYFSGMAQYNPWGMGTTPYTSALGVFGKSAPYPATSSSYFYSPPGW